MRPVNENKVPDYSRNSFECRRRVGIKMLMELIFDLWSSGESQPCLPDRGKCPMGLDIYLARAADTVSVKCWNLEAVPGKGFLVELSPCACVPSWSCRFVGPCGWTKVPILLLMSYAINWVVNDIGLLVFSTERIKCHKCSYIDWGSADDREEIGGKLDTDGMWQAQDGRGVWWSWRKPRKSVVKRAITWLILISGGLFMPIM